MIQFPLKNVSYFKIHNDFVFLEIQIVTVLIDSSKNKNFINDLSFSFSSVFQFVYKEVFKFLQFLRKLKNLPCEYPPFSL